MPSIRLCRVRRDSTRLLRLDINIDNDRRMPGLQADDEQKEEKLKAALWYSTGQTVDAVAVSQDLNTTPHFIGGLSEMCWAQIENIAKDLEAFAKHGGRSTINAKDVLLLGRRNDGLKAVLEAEAKEVKKMNAR
ncbi:MHF histone-fold complex component [Elasticomyces elasticus]|nr:MHF histone-fold complex component [Elasticomyces elasticus]KAK3652546.1 MHF histone-fold complex component [Elasticomyces elasticus]KAK4919252.1 MHF histone-fold complex component [Elasticomyces elasticus]KAK5757809.1 MHF histone-fold complex component [Elasticomyces elasticus]